MCTVLCVQVRFPFSSMSLIAQLYVDDNVAFLFSPKPLILTFVSRPRSLLKAAEREGAAR